MQRRIILLFLVLAFCMLDLLIEVNPFLGPHTTAISSAIEVQQQDNANLTWSQLAEKKFQELNAKARRDGVVSVIVKLRVAVRPEGQMLRGADRRAQRFAIIQTQDSLLQCLYGYDLSSLIRFGSIPFVSMKVNTSGLEALRFSSNVAGIYEDELVPIALAESASLVGAPIAWANGYSGAGKAVAILDTGVDKDHPFLLGKVISEGCYSTNLTSQGASSLCPGGVTDSISLDSGRNCAGISGCEHGTHVAGIAAGRGTAFSGIAKDAYLISIQVFSRIDNISNCGGISPCIRSFTSDIMRALERVYELRDTYSIAAVNLSLGGGRFTSYCDDHPLKGIIDQLRSVGIAT